MAICIGRLEIIRLGERSESMTDSIWLSSDRRKLGIESMTPQLATCLIGEALSMLPLLNKNSHLHIHDNNHRHVWPQNKQTAELYKGSIDDKRWNKSEVLKVWCPVLVGRLTFWICKPGVMATFWHLYIRGHRWSYVGRKTSDQHEIGTTQRKKQLVYIPEFLLNHSSVGLWSRTCPVASSQLASALRISIKNLNQESRETFLKSAWFIARRRVLMGRVTE
jgi:hypothetical protein